MKNLIFLALIFINTSQASTPKLNFSDLVSGPATGLSDDNGSGVIVTIWGQFLGEEQGDSKIIITELNGTTHENSYVYYWKNADGVLPSGPANLYKSHRMQEIAFSLPDVPLGDVTITVEVAGIVSNTIPFEIRTGQIYHIKTTGQNSGNSVGDFNNPWKTLRYALNTITIPGATIYIHDSHESVGGTGPYQGKAIFWDTSSATSDGYTNQMGIIAYPNSQPVANSGRSVSNFHTSGMVISKYKVKASFCHEVNGNPVTTPGGTTACSPSSGSFGIQGTAYGRIIGNTITDRDGRCAEGMQGGIYAVNGGEEDRISGLKIYGNEIYDYGCNGTSKFQHTTYLSIRQGSNPQIDSWQIGWNYLHDNQAKFGIHNFDQTGTLGGVCGQPQGSLNIKNNVIVNQSGPGINVAVVRCASWANDINIYNNLLIDTGKLSSWDGSNPNSSDSPAPGAITVGNGGLQGDVNIYNNTIYKWDTDDAQFGVKSCLGFVDGRGYGPSLVDFSQNICLTDLDKVFLGFNVNSGPYSNELIAQLSGADNVLYFSGINPVNSLPPTLDGNPIYTTTFSTDPLIDFDVENLTVGILQNSMIRSSVSPLLTHDIYGNIRSINTEPGAISYTVSDVMFSNGFE